MKFLEREREKKKRIDKLEYIYNISITLYYCDIKKAVISIPY